MSSLEAPRLALVLCLWALVLGGAWRLRGRSPFYLPTVALFVTGLVGSFFPLVSCFIQPAGWRNLELLSPDVVLDTQLQYAAFAAGLVGAVAIASHCRWLARDGSNPSDSAAPRDFAVSALLVSAGLALYALYAQKVGLSALTDREDYAYKYLLSRGLGPLQLGLPMAIAGCLWAESSALPRAQKNLFLPIAAGITLWSIVFISVRTNAVLLALGYLACFARQRRLELRRVKPAIVAALLVLYVGLESFALLRGLYRGSLADAVGRLQSQGELAVAAAVGGSELSHPFITAGEVLRDREPGELVGRSLLDGVAACLPRGLYPDRPLMLSEQFVRSNYAELAARGGGAAFSLVAEGWLDFGSLLGPLAFGLAMGLVLAWAELRREQRPDGLVARLLPYFVFYVAMQHRNEFGTLFKQVFMLALVVLPAWLAGDTLARVLSRPSAPRALRARS